MKLFILQGRSSSGYWFPVCFFLGTFWTITADIGSKYLYHPCYRLQRVKTFKEAQKLENSHNKNLQLSQDMGEAEWIT